MALILLVRHGQTDENVSGRISGQGSAPLNGRGQEQAKLAAQVLAPLNVSRLVSSPVVRALETATILDAHLQLGIEEEPDLREVGYGDWEGQTFQAVRGGTAFQLALNDPINAVFPNGESLVSVQQRGVRVVESIRQGAPQDVVVLVSHGDVIRMLVAHYLGMTFNDYRRITIDNGAISVIELFDQWIRVKAVNFVPQVGNLWLESFYATWQKTQNLVKSSHI
jgi:broad specificity phosphatase PhoE